MRPTLAAILLFALVCCLSGAACRGDESAREAQWGGASGPDEVLAEANSFTAELMRKVETARDPAEGLTEAQSLLDSRQENLAARISALKRSRGLREDEDARSRLLECEVENVRNVSTLRTKYIAEAMRDDGFRSRLDRFVSDYESLWRE